MRFPYSSLTEILAAYGALLSSVGFGWNLYRDLLDRAKLQVSANVRKGLWSELTGNGSR